MQPPDSSLWMLVWRVGRVLRPIWVEEHRSPPHALGVALPSRLSGSLVQAKSQGGSPGLG